MVDSRLILNAIDDGSIEPLLDGGDIIVLIDREPVFTIPLQPLARVTKTINNAVNVFSGESLVATVQAASEEDAEMVAEMFEGMIQYGSPQAIQRQPQGRSQTAVAENSGGRKRR